MVRVVIFFVVSAGIVGLSWRSLKVYRVHGFYRFFAFESLAALILLNSPVWFRNPLSVRQMASWCLGATSIALAIEGFRLLRIIGRPSAAVAQTTNLGFENTTALVAVGAYRLIRHPLYTSLLALALCAYLKAPWMIGSILLALSATGFLIATAIVEERENLARFGEGYSAYMQRTRRFIPFVF